MSGYISSPSSSEGSPTPRSTPAAAAPAPLSLLSRPDPYQTAFFQNAKPARMLEMGLVRSIQTLQTGDQGLLVEDDGPSIEVKVLKTPYSPNAGPNYIFTNLTTGEEIIARIQERYKRWDFYTHTTPVPFVPRPGSIEAASLSASSQLLGGGGSTSAPFLTASAPPLSPSSYAASAARPPTPRTLQTVNVTPGGKRKLRKTRARKMRKNKMSLRRKRSKLTKA